MNGVILRWPVPIGTTINAQYYKKVLQDKLRPAIRKKRPGLLESGILFHHDNAPVHTARAVTDVLAGYKWELLEHPRYSPDLAPSALLPCHASWSQDMCFDNISLMSLGNSSSKSFTNRQNLYS
ncbi:hypothetical protein RRG08_023922 [Elysia crispata]|uniref:Transposase n=1 Tax=Elysia crispata TaxID=231223 RepID=A0AAE0YMD7_9GAST|nr:hypothetical protein RRG08_023922 [Elysia crispata]